MADPAPSPRTPPFREAVDRIHRWAKARDAAMARARRRAVLFLLGPGYPPEELERRRRLARGLADLGVNAIVMEDLPAWRSATLTGKFLDILEDFEPHLYLAIFTRRGRPLGLTFELGLLTGVLGLDRLLGKLRYCIEATVDEADVMTAYVREQLPMARTVRFRSDEGLLRAALNFVDNLALEEGWVRPFDLPGREP